MKVVRRWRWGNHVKVVRRCRWVYDEEVLRRRYNDPLLDHVIESPKVVGGGLPGAEADGGIFVLSGRPDLPERTKTFLKSILRKGRVAGCFETATAMAVHSFSEVVSVVNIVFVQ